MTPNPHVGWRFPFRFEDGRVARSGGVSGEDPTNEELAEAVVSNLRQIILTGRGERPMIGQFGLGADRFAFLPLQEILPGLVEKELREQVLWWSGRAVITKVESRSDPIDGQIVFDTYFNYRDDNTEQMLSFIIRGTSRE